ncbi:MAG: ribonuclease III domain-containing protein [Benniella sp.]|nr:MAG: ribonuclease III domain-containing protein [Benniella sp.]
MFEPTEETLWSQVSDVESILDYKFTDRSLLVTALRPAKGNRDQAVANNDGLEFLGDSVLELIAPIFFTLEQRQLNQLGPLKCEGLTNVALQAVCLFAGLDGHLLELREVDRASNVITRANYQAARAGGGKYWKRVPENKLLADAVEAVFGAVFLDSGMDLNAALRLFRRLHWPAVGRFM